jgi:hypothetical protein
MKSTFTHPAPRRMSVPSGFCTDDTGAIHTLYITKPWEYQPALAHAANGGFFDFNESVFDPPATKSAAIAAQKLFQGA